MSKDYYKILGVDKNSSKEDIKRAYKKLAKQHHPDLNKGNSESEQKFKEINEAASVLTDDKKRQQYDQFGSEGMNRGGGFGEGFSGFSQGDFGGFDINDIFDSFFGGGGSRGRTRGPRPGQDLRYDIEITLEEVSSGVTKHIEVKKKDTCPDCSGKGGEGVTTCPVCHGAGIVNITKRTPFGMFQQRTTCNNCSGKGNLIDNICHTCQGSGATTQKKKIKIDIPKGIMSGTQLRIPNEGEPGEPGAPKGNLYVFIHVEDHEFFERDNDDLYIEIPISFTTAALGGTIKVPTIDSKAELKIPSGTQPGTLFKMKDIGLPHLRASYRGDQYVKITIEVPDKLSKKQKDLLSEFDKSIKEKPAHVRFFEKIKKAFE